MRRSSTAGLRTIKRILSREESLSDLWRQASAETKSATAAMPALAAAAAAAVAADAGEHAEDRQDAADTADTSANDSNASDFVDEDDDMVHVSELIRRASFQYREERAGKERELQAKVLAGENHPEALEHERGLQDKQTKHLLEAIAEASLLSH